MQTADKDKAMKCLVGAFTQSAERVDNLGEGTWATGREGQQLFLCVASLLSCIRQVGLHSYADVPNRKAEKTFDVRFRTFIV